MINCKLCNATDVVNKPCLFNGIMECKQCGFMFAVSLTDPAAPELYEANWSKTEVHPTYVFHQGQYKIHNQRKLLALLARVEPYRKLNRILDVGCSAAFFLKTAKNCRWQVQGVEISDFGVQFSRTELGIDVFQGMLHEARFPDESFDVVCSSHVIEHVSDPRHLVREMRRILRRGGALLTVLPTQFAAPCYRYFGKLDGDGPPRHVSFFSKHSWESLLHNEGFTLTFSRQNIELQRLLRAARGTPYAIGSAKMAAASTIPEPGALMRFVKANVNCMGTLLGIGDELTTIGVKI